MNNVKGTATSELSMLKDGTIKRVMTFKTLADAGMMETGKEYVIGAQDSPVEATAQESVHIRALRAYHELGAIIDELREENESLTVECEVKAAVILRYEREAMSENQPEETQHEMNIRITAQSQSMPIRKLNLGMCDEGDICDEIPAQEVIDDIAARDGGDDVL